MNTLPALLLLAACLLPAVAAEAPTFSFADLPQRLQEELYESTAGQPAADGAGLGTLTVTEADVVGDPRRELVFRYTPPEISGERDDWSPWHAAWCYPGHERMEERGYVCEADGTLLHAVPLFFFHGQREGDSLRGERAQVFRPRGTHQELMYDARWSMDVARAELSVEKGGSKPNSSAMESMQDVRVLHDRRGWMVHESPIEPEYHDIMEERLRGRADESANRPLPPSLLEGAPTWSISLHELLTQDSPRWRAAGEAMPAEALRQARAWTQAEACRAFEPYVVSPSGQPELEIVAISGSGHVVFDIRNTGDRPVAYVPLGTDAMRQYTLHTDNSLRGSHPKALYTSTFFPVTTPPLLLMPGEGYRDAGDFGMFPSRGLHGVPRVWMEYRFGLEERQQLEREVKSPFPCTAAERDFWRGRWAAVKDCLVPRIKSRPLELPQGCMERKGRGEQVIVLRAAVQEEGGALRLRFETNSPGHADYALPAPDSPGVAAGYSLLVLDVRGREWTWAARPEGTPQPVPGGDEAEAAEFRQRRELVVLPPSPEALAALGNPVTLLLCYEPADEGESLASAPFHVLPAYFQRQLPAPMMYEDVAEELKKGDILPTAAEDRRPELTLSSMDVQGRAFCYVENTVGKAPIALPRAGWLDAAPAYRLHLWDALGRETQLPARSVWTGMPLGGYAAWQLIAAGESEAVAIDFPPLTPQQRRRTRRMAVSYDAARCEGQEWHVPAAAEGEATPSLAPAMMSEQRPLLPGGWESHARRRELNDLRLTLLSLDRGTGEARCTIRNDEYGDAHAYFVPGNSWGDDCFTLTVQDAEGREHHWRVQREAYFRNVPKPRSLKAGETEGERIDFGFDDVDAPTEEQAAFLAALRRPGALVRLDYGMTQAGFLSAHAFTDGRDAEEVEHFNQMQRLMVRGMRSTWQAVEALPEEE